MNPLRSTWIVCRIFRSGFSFRRNVTRPPRARHRCKSWASSFVKGNDRSRSRSMSRLRPHVPPDSLTKGLPSSQRHGVVIGEDEEVVPVGTPQPGHQLVPVPVRLVSVVRVEEGDAIDLVGDHLDGVQGKSVNS